jgi:ABC-type hemin transport system ATPase subunit
VFSNPEYVKKVEGQTAFDCVGLNSSQEEADTCIILHALNMNNQFKDKNVMGRIVIKSPDTDVLILLQRTMICIRHVQEYIDDHL